MKTKLQPDSRLLLFAYLFIALNVYCTLINAQNAIEVKNTQLPPPSPNEERFEKSDGIVLPSRSVGCHSLNYSIRERTCREITQEEWHNTAVVTLYNENGTVWYRYTHKPKSIYSKQNEPEEHFLYNKMGFIPLAMIGDIVSILRLVSESEHWYQVEVDIETKATRFVLKSDPRWAKKDWSYFLTEVKHFDLVEEQSLRDKPQGKVSEAIADLKFSAVRFLKVDKDWAYVEAELKGEKKLYQGWVQWRKEDELLITDNLKNVYFFKPEDKKIMFRK